MTVPQKTYLKLSKKVKQAIRRFAMFEPNDRLVVALSGGKDSIALVWILRQLGYHPEALFLNLGIGEHSAEAEQTALRFCREQGIVLHIIDAAAETGFTIDQISADYPDHICSACGSVKRKLYNRFALDHHFDVLLTGHNLDDEAIFLFSNNRRWDWAYIQKSYPVLAAKDGFVKRAKPLCLVREAQLEDFILKAELPYVASSCPYAKKGNLWRTHQIFSGIESTLPGFVEEYYKNFLANYSFFQDRPVSAMSLSPCRSCGDLSTQPVCKVCLLRQRLWQR